MCSKGSTLSLLVHNSGPAMQLLAAMLLLSASIYIIASPHSNDSARHFAYAMVGVLIPVIWPNARPKPRGRKTR